MLDLCPSGSCCQRCPLLLCLPLVHFAREKLRPDLKIDHGSPEWKAREALIARAKVFIHPERPVSSLDFVAAAERSAPAQSGPRGGLPLRPQAHQETTPKFDCELPNGDVIKSGVRPYARAGWRSRRDAPACGTWALAPTT